MREFITLTCFLCLTLAGNTQTSFWEGGLIMGGSVMSGDLVDQQMGSLNDVNVALGLMGRRYFSPNWAFRASLIHSRLAAADERSMRLAERGFRTETPLTELAIDLEFDILGHRRGKIGLISPYIFVGGGVSLINPKTFYNTANGDATIDRNKDISKTRFVMPLGAGLRLDLKHNLAITLELAPRATFSDYLDGVSVSGNPDNKDWYGFGTVQLLYKLTTTDRDGDGIADMDDACPELAGSPLASGCPDRDNDGVADTLDTCPDMPGVAGLSGCPDSDGDGITDAEDTCPTQSGPAATGGCPDGDGDGIVDGEDACPLEAGKPEFNGCPSLDTDGDGIKDSDDACPEEAGPAATRGCPNQDTDKDGILDADDQCPEVAGSLANNGCPERASEPEADVQEAMDFATRNIRFATNNNELLPSAYAILDNVAQVLKDNPDFNLKIEGFTDSRGTSAYNLNLSILRARRCYEYLLGKGIPANRMEYKGFGESNPVASNATEKGRLQNRRVEFSLVK